MSHIFKNIKCIKFFVILNLISTSNLYTIESTAQKAPFINNKNKISATRSKIEKVKSDLEKLQLTPYGLENWVTINHNQKTEAQKQAIILSSKIVLSMAIFNYQFFLEQANALLNALLSRNIGSPDIPLPDIPLLKIPDSDLDRILNILDKVPVSYEHIFSLQNNANEINAIITNVRLPDGSNNKGFPLYLVLWLINKIFPDLADNLRRHQNFDFLRKLANYLGNKGLQSSVTAKNFEELLEPFYIVFATYRKLPFGTKLGLEQAARLLAGKWLTK